MDFLTGLKVALKKAFAMMFFLGFAWFFAFGVGRFGGVLSRVLGIGLRGALCLAHGHDFNQKYTSLSLNLGGNARAGAWRHSLTFKFICQNIRFTLI